MSIGSRSIAALAVVLGMAALCVSCGPGEKPGDPGSAAFERQASQAPAPAPRPDSSAFIADTAEPGPAEPTTGDPSPAATQQADPPPEETSKPTLPPAPSPSQPKKPATLPRLVDLGADKCIPCKTMAPILEELKRDYAGQVDVEFIDVWKDPEPGRAYGIKVIPTQIFFDASGAERFRHEGFFGKEDILKKWAELGVTLRPPRD